jgi:hypothetical protein
MMKSFFGDLIDERCGGDFDVIPHLQYIYSIVHVKISLTFHWIGEFVLNKIEEDIGGAFIQGSNSKVTGLSFEDDTFAVNGARIEAGFV